MTVRELIEQLQTLPDECLDWEVASWTQYQSVDELWKMHGMELNKPKEVIVLNHGQGDPV